jgi:hypothetical protein
LDGVSDFPPANVTPTITDTIFEQGHNLTGGQMRVQLSGHAEKPRVDAFPGTRRLGKRRLDESGE